MPPTAPIEHMLPTSEQIERGLPEHGPEWDQRGARRALSLRRRRPVSVAWTFRDEERRRQRDDDHQHAEELQRGVPAVRRRQGKASSGTSAPPTPMPR